MPFTKTNFKGLFFSAIVISVLSACTSSAANDCRAEHYLLETKVRMLEAKVDSLTTALTNKEVKASANIKAKNVKSQSSKAVVAPSYVSSDYSTTNYSSGKSSYSSSRCQATTKKGSQCKRNTRSGNYCWQHGG